MGEKNRIYCFTRSEFFNSNYLYIYIYIYIKYHPSVCNSNESALDSREPTPNASIAAKPM